MPQVHAVNHPLVQHHLVQLRDKSTKPVEFRLLINRLATILAYEVTEDLELRPQDVTTPICKTTGHVLKQRIGIVPILAGRIGDGRSRL